jgi:uncharacterized protein
MELLTPVEVRVLGALAEKEVTTPDYYPLSLNALIAACNQKSSRDPVMDLREDQVRDALSSLGDKRLAGPVSSADSRVTKYEHRLQEVFNFDRREAALICALLLRGPQTPGELRSRTDRMHHFEELYDVQSTLQKLAQREPPLVTMLRRQPGTKEARYAHLFSGPVDDSSAQALSETTPRGSSVDPDLIARLEAEVSELRQKLAALEEHLANLEASR